MIIYHKTDNKIYNTCVILGADKTSISTGTFIWGKHKEQVQKLENNSDVFVTGGTHYGAVYSGMFCKREKYQQYLKDIK